jgi:hypothetical protein
MSDPAIVGWASGWLDYQPGPNVDPIWQTPDLAKGAAQGTQFDIVVLGDSGRITLMFDHPIADGAGWDLAVFENSFSDTFLELAWVEVSSDGAAFFRFPSDSLTAASVPFVGGAVDPTDVDGLAGKYRAGFGTPFDLAQLAGTTGLDIAHVTHVRLVDVVGDGTAHDTSGDVIYDPYPTALSGGFDLDAVGVLHQSPEPAGLAILLSGAAVLLRRRKGR